MVVLVMMDKDEHFEELAKLIEKLQAERDNLKQQVYNLEADKQHLLDNNKELEIKLEKVCDIRDRYKGFLQCMTSGILDPIPFDVLISQAKQTLEELKEAEDDE